MNDILKRTKQCDEEEIRKRKLAGEYSPGYTFIDGRHSVRSNISPSPNEEEMTEERMSASIEHNTLSVYNESNGVDNRFVEKPLRRSSPSSEMNGNFDSKHRHLHQQAHHHHRSENNNLSYPPRTSPVKLSCQCDDCTIPKQRFHYNGDSEHQYNGQAKHHYNGESKHLYNGESGHSDSISPSQIVPKNMNSLTNNYNGHSKRRHHEIFSDDEHMMTSFERYNRSAHKPAKSNTSLTEMSLNIQHRTDNTVMLSIVLDGVYYSGKLFSMRR